MATNNKHSMALVPLLIISIQLANTVLFYFYENAWIWSWGTFVMLGVSMIRIVISTLFPSRWEENISKYWDYIVLFTPTSIVIFYILLIVLLVLFLGALLIYKINFALYSLISLIVIELQIQISFRSSERKP